LPSGSGVRATGVLRPTTRPRGGKEARIVHHVLAVLPQFALACLVLALLPGPATALFVHRTVRDGRAAGLAAVAGSEIGVFGWALAAGAGLTALLQANRLLFETLHLVGALVLVYLGVAAWRAAHRPEAGLAQPGWLSSGRSPMAAFRASLVSIAANPKAAVFAFSFFPQFLPQHGAVFATGVGLALIQVVIDTTYCAVLVLLALRVRPWLSRIAVRRYLERILGTILVALGVQLAAQTR
jgi:threonine/homoserine/homoserine lactone efflux protein